jgi:hypothetical protein
MKLSTRRRLTLALGVACGLMMIFLLLQRQLGWGSTYKLLPDQEIERDASLDAPLKESRNPMPTVLSALEINDRALFTPTRTAPAKVAPPAPVVENKIPQVPLNAQLTGVVITPLRKVAILRSNSGGVTYRLREGMPFPGELAGWRVVQINNRSVLFDGGQSGMSELKLDVSKESPTSTALPSMPQPQSVPQVTGKSPVAPMEMPRPNPPGFPQPPPPQAPGMTSAANPDQAAREAEVQRIIEERRAQMRAEAERMNSEKQQ